MVLSGLVFIMILVLVYSAFTEKFGIRPGNMTVSSLAGGLTSSRQPPSGGSSSSVVNPPSGGRPPSGERPPSGGGSPRIIEREIIRSPYPVPYYRGWRRAPAWRHWRRPYWNGVNYYWNTVYPNQNVVLDCDNNCCDRSICYETGGLCDWSIAGQNFNGTPEQCIRHKECVGRNMGDVNMCGNILNN